MKTLLKAKGIIEIDDSIDTRKRHGLNPKNRMEHLQDEGVRSLVWKHMQEAGRQQRKMGHGGDLRLLLRRN